MNTAPALSQEEPHQKLSLRLPGAAVLVWVGIKNGTDPHNFIKPRNASAVVVLYHTCMCCNAQPQQQCHSTTDVLQYVIPPLPRSAASAIASEASSSSSISYSVWGANYRVSHASLAELATKQRRQGLLFFLVF